MSYGKAHKLFLQRMVALRCVSEAEAIQIFRKVHDNATDDQFPRFIDLINRRLSPYFLSVSKGRAEDDGSLYYALINTTEDEYAKLASEFQPNEIAFIKKTLEQIVNSESGSIPSMDLMNIGAELETKMTVSASESLLQKLVNEKWLQEIDGDHSLGPRSIIELDPYMRKIFEDAIPDCKICSNFVIRGQSCGNCGIRIHNYCAVRYFRGRSADNQKCPVCSVPWVVEVIEPRKQGRKRRNCSD